MGIWSSIGSILGGPWGEAAGNAYDSYASERNNEKLQKEFAQNSISWRVADAKRAGIHPLAALGNMGVSYQPFAVGGGEGQDLSRAIMANMDANERREAAARETARLAVRDKMDAETHALSMQRGSLENELLRSQIARANSSQVGPGVPRGNAPPGAVNSVPARVEVGSPDMPSRAPGVLNEWQFQRTARGYALVQSEQSKERNEDSIGDWAWYFRNTLIPPAAIRGELNRLDPPPPGMSWQWNPLAQEFRLERGLDRSRVQQPAYGAGRAY